MQGRGRGSIDDMSDDAPDPDADPWWHERMPVHLIDGPLAGQTITAPARLLPPIHLHVLPGDPVRARAGDKPPEDPTGWHLYEYTGTTRREDRIQEFRHRPSS